MIKRWRMRLAWTLTLTMQRWVTMLTYNFMKKVTDISLTSCNQVTLNLCLTSSHEGGELFLLGTDGQSDLTVQHRFQSKWFSSLDPILLFQAGLWIITPWLCTAWCPSSPEWDQDQFDNVVEVIFKIQLYCLCWELSMYNAPQKISIGTTFCFFTPPCH